MIISSNTAIDKLLKPLGIETKNLRSCTMHFEMDDIVRVTVVYLLEDPGEEAILVLKKYALTELEDMENETN